MLVRRDAFARYVNATIRTLICNDFRILANTYNETCGNRSSSVTLISFFALRHYIRHVPTASPHLRCHLLSGYGR